MSGGLFSDISCRTMCGQAWPPY